METPTIITTRTTRKILKDPVFWKLVVKRMVQLLEDSELKKKVNKEIREAKKKGRLKEYVQHDIFKLAIAEHVQARKSEGISHSE